MKKDTEEVKVRIFLNEMVAEKRSFDAVSGDNKSKKARDDKSNSLLAVESITPIVPEECMLQFGQNFDDIMIFSLSQWKISPKTSLIFL